MIPAAISSVRRRKRIWRILSRRHIVTLAALVFQSAPCHFDQPLSNPRRWLPPGVSRGPLALPALFDGHAEQLSQTICRLFLVAYIFPAPVQAPPAYGLWRQLYRPRNRSQRAIQQSDVGALARARLPTPRRAFDSSSILRQPVLPPQQREQTDQGSCLRVTGNH